MSQSPLDWLKAVSIEEHPVTTEALPETGVGEEIPPLESEEEAAKGFPDGVKGETQKSKVGVEDGLGEEAPCLDTPIKTKVSTETNDQQAKIGGDPAIGNEVPTNTHTKESDATLTGDKATQVKAKVTADTAIGAEVPCNKDVGSEDATLTGEQLESVKTKVAEETGLGTEVPTNQNLGIIASKGTGGDTAKEAAAKAGVEEGLGEEIPEVDPTISVETGVVAEGGVTEEPVVTNPVETDPLETASLTPTESQTPTGEAVPQAPGEPTVTVESQEPEYEPEYDLEIEDPVEDTVHYMTEMADDLENIDRVSTALEAYHRLLDEAITTQQFVSPQVIQAMHIGLQALGESSVMRHMPSMETFDDPAGRLTASTESIEGIKASLKELGKTVREVVARLFDFLTDTWNRISANTGEMLERLDKVQGKLRKVTGENTAPLTLNGVGRLSINGFFVGDTVQPMRDINDLAEYFAVKYPKMMQGVLHNFETILMQSLSDGGKDPRLADKGVNAATRAFLGSFHMNGIRSEKAREQEIPSAFGQARNVMRSKILPGNMAMFYALYDQHYQTDRPEAQITSEQSMLVMIRENLKMEFARIDNTRGEPNEQVKVPNAGVIKQMLAEVAAMISQLEDLKDAASTHAAYRNRLTRSVNALMEHDFSNLKDINTLRFAVSGIARMYTLPSGNLFGYVASMVKLYTVVIERYIDHHLALAAK